MQEREGRSEHMHARPGTAQAGCSTGQKKERGEIEPVSLFLFRICFFYFLEINYGLFELIWIWIWI
jgi:hypothetical protein